ncbi:MAG: carboxypeptidase regulatory-like domain-containing protein [Acidimicrobiia bacterium]|nr:carboxypeptidase regulatory-like domain-containing protein [Acidimicrobiia bacterium]
MRCVVEKPVSRGWMAVMLLLLSAGLAFSQATGTINGRVIDQAEAVLPGVTVTITNTDTGVVREVVTNAEGLYSVPGLQPGRYKIAAAMQGFATLTRDGVVLAVTATITVDLTLGVAALAETVTVAGAAPMIETTQSTVSSTIRTQEVQSLPMLTRRFTQLMTMLPGAREVAPLHPIKRQQGSVSVGGAQGRNITPLVDGADNRDNLVGGPMMAFTMEGTEEFRVNTHQFTAADGRSGGATVALVTKSGTNEVRGSTFLYDRERDLMKKDFFAVRDNVQKDPFSRRQYGGSLGGPILQNRAFYFGAMELIHERKSITIPNNVYDQVRMLEPFGAKPSRTIPQPYNDRMYTLKGNVQLNQGHSLTASYAGQKHTAFDGNKTQRTMSDLSTTTLEEASYWSAVVQHNWVHGSNFLNQLTVHRNHMYGVNDQTGSRGAGQDRSLFFHLNYPAVTRLPTLNTMTFPSFSVGNPSTSYDYAQDLWQVRDAVTWQRGGHALRFGADFNWMPTFG